MSVDLVRIVDSIHRDKNIPKEVLFEGIESALATAAKKHYPDAEEIQVTIDPDSGKIRTLTDGHEVEPPEFGRIAAQTAKQVIIQKIREAERDSLFDEFEDQRGTGTTPSRRGGPRGPSRSRPVAGGGVRRTPSEGVHEPRSGPHRR